MPIQFRRLNALPDEFRRVLRQHRWALGALICASSMVNLLMLVGPVFMLQVYDRVLPSKSFATLAGLLFIAVVLYIVQALVDAIRNRLLARLSEAFDLSIRDHVFEAVHQSALKSTQTDGLQLIRDLDTVRGFIAGSGPIAAFDLPWTPIYILVCFLFHPWMGVAVFAGAIVLCTINAAAEVSIRKPTGRLIGQMSTRRTTAETAFRHAETIHALGMKRRLNDIWSSQSSAYLDTQRHLSDLSSTFGSVSRFCRMLMQSGILAIGALLVINQQATAGVMLAATILSIRALSPIELAIANWRSFIASRNSFKRLLEIFDDTRVSTPTPLPAPRRELKVTSVSVTVPDTGAVVLHDVSFALAAGQAVAVVGASGSGKSTLARALVGAWPAARGVIRIDGAALDQWDPVARGQHIGFVPQDVALFRGTVAENITRFTPAPNPEKLIAAATAANVHDLILSLPHGYETEVGDGGVSLSGGQRQRIALARALYGDPFLIVLDEPNSNLDTEGEQALIRAIVSARSRGAIVVLIAHRTKAIEAASHLLVLNQGRMHAFGETKAVLPLISPRPTAQPAAVQKPPARRRSRARKQVADAAE
jgi:PrtD family type I secretion system ABC transporter